MATNPPKDNSRKGSVKNRSQFQNTNTGLYIKRDTKTGKFLDVKTRLVENLKEYGKKSKTKINLI